VSDLKRMRELEAEPPRLFGRLHSLRGWSDGNTEQVISGSSGAGGAHGARALARARLEVGGDGADRRQDRLVKFGPVVACFCEARRALWPIRIWLFGATAGKLNVGRF
jgi:hypothetical protein